MMRVKVGFLFYVSRHQQMAYSNRVMGVQIWELHCGAALLQAQEGKVMHVLNLFEFILLLHVTISINNIYAFTPT